MTVINLYIYHCLLKVKSNYQMYCTKAQTHEYQTRYNYHLNISSVRLQKSKNWFKYAAPNIFNKLPIDARNMNIRLFKQVLKRPLTLN